MRIPRFAREFAPSSRDDAILAFDFVLDPEPARVDQDRLQFVVHVAGAAEQQQAGLRRDRDADFVRDDLAVAADKFFLVQEDADEALEACAATPRATAARIAHCARVRLAGRDPAAGTMPAVGGVVAATAVPAVPQAPRSQPRGWQRSRTAWTSAVGFLEALDELDVRLPGLRRVGALELRPRVVFRAIDERERAGPARRSRRPRLPACTSAYRRSMSSSSGRFVSFCMSFAAASNFFCMSDM